MTIYYVGPGGNDTNDGLSWANRFLTHNGAEDEPVAAGDTVWVGPGIYREKFTVDVSGSSGSPITYIADVTGEHTDGVGGVVRITGSDDDLVGTRSNSLVIGAFDYRTFRGYRFDTVSGTSSYVISMDNGADNIIIEDCTFNSATSQYGAGIYIGAATNVTIQRCIFTGLYYAISQNPGSVYESRSVTIQNCIFWGVTYGLYSNVCGGVLVNNCTFLGNYYGVRLTGALSTSTLDVENSMFQACQYALVATATGDLVEDYNTFWGNGTDRNNVATGSNSKAYPPLFEMPLLLDEYALPPPAWGSLSPDSQVAAITGSTAAADDLHGITRPATASKKGWGAAQFNNLVRETTITHGSTAASLELSDAGVVQFRVPVTAVSTTISVYVYREANYAGTNPRMVIKQPGQSDRVTTDVGSSGAWNELTDTFTPAASPGYVIVELQSLNTATSGSYAVYFDTLTVE